MMLPAVLLRSIALRGALWVVIALLMAGCRERTLPIEQAAAQGILLVGNGPEPESLDPLFSTSTSALQVQQAIFEGLTTPDPRNLSATPGVAERWEVDEDGRRYRFFLREDARWSDGKPVRAEDFVFAWRRMLDPEAGGANASLLYLIEGAEGFHQGTHSDWASVGVRAESSRELVIRLEWPAPWFASMLAHPAFFPVPESVVRAHGAPHQRDNPWIRPGNFVGNGPFTLRQWRPTELIEVERNPYYWDHDTVALDGIRFFAISDPGAEERAFQGGQLHITEALPPARVRAYRESDSPFLRIDPYLGVYYVLINHRHPELSRLEVRQALSEAIRREVICQQLLGAGQVPAYSFTPPRTPGYLPPTFPAGVTPAPVPDASAGRMTYLYNSSESNRLIAEALREMWRNGTSLNLELENVEFRTYLARREHHDFDLARAVWIGDYLDPMTFLGLWQTGAAGSDWSGWSDPRYDQLLAEANREADPAARAARLRQAESLLLEQHVMAPIYHFVTVYLLRPEVSGWFPTLLDWHPWKHVGLGTSPHAAE